MSLVSIPPHSAEVSASTQLDHGTVWPLLAKKVLWHSGDAHVWVRKPAKLFEMLKVFNISGLVPLQSLPTPIMVHDERAEHTSSMQYYLWEREAAWKLTSLITCSQCTMVKNEAAPVWIKNKQQRGLRAPSNGKKLRMNFLQQGQRKWENNERGKKRMVGVRGREQ